MSINVRRAAPTPIQTIEIQVPNASFAPAQFFLEVDHDSAFPGHVRLETGPANNLTPSGLRNLAADLEKAADILEEDA